MPARTRRPGPLKELPLELFALQDTPSIPSSPFKASAKRARSPGVMNTPMSPAKRRILNDEGVAISPQSPKTSEKPRGPSYMAMGMLSSRRLDFDNAVEMKTPSEQEAHKVHTPSTPRAQRVAAPVRKLAPSPELVPSPPSARQREKESISSDFSAHEISSPSSPYHLFQDFQSTHRQSSHYPGFDVYRETGLVMPSDCQLTEELDLEDDTKENVAPPKRSLETTILKAPSFTKCEKGPATPRRGSQMKVSTTPGAATPRASVMGTTPTSKSVPRPLFTTNRSPDKLHLKNRRRALEEEVDETAALDDDGSL